MSPPRSRWRTGAAVVVAVVLGGCSGGSRGVTPAAWASGVCGRIVAFRDQAGALQSEVQSRLREAGANASAARDELLGALDRMVRDADQMLTGVEDRGVPDTQHGAAMAGRLREGLLEVRSTLTGARAKAQELPVDDPSAFQGSAAEVVTTLQGADDQAATALATARQEQGTPALDAALDGAAECRTIPAPGAVPAATWAGDFCGRMVAWQRELRRLVTDLQGQLPTVGRDLPAARTRLVDFMTQVASATDRLVGETERAGAPDVEGGRQVADDLTGGLQEVRQAFEQGRVNAENLDVNDPGAFSAGAEEISQNIRQAVDRTQQEFRALSERQSVPALNQAFADAPACQEIGG